MDRGFAHEDHTADLIVRAWGPTLPAAFEEAARGLVSYMVEVAKAGTSEERTLVVAAEDDSLLLVRFLEEVRFLLETQSLVLHEFDVALSEGRLVAHARGEPYDAKRHGHIHEIKAVTLHGATIRREPPEVAYVVDI